MSDTLELIARGRDNSQAIASYLLGEPNRRLSNSRESRWRNHGSFHMTLTGRYAGKWRDEETNEHGDVLDLIERELSLDRNAAIRWLSGYFGGSPMTPLDHAVRKAEIERAEIADDKARKAKRDAAAAIWRQAVPISSTLAERYLVARLGGKPVPLDVLEAGNLRFHPAPLYGAEQFDGLAGALIARMVDPVTGEARGLQRVFLTSDARKIERRMLGAAGVVPLTRFEDVTTGLGIGEGIETSLAVISEMDWRPMWATLSAGAMRKFPVLDGVEALTIFADADESGTGQTAGEECGQRWANAGRGATMYLPPKIGQDFGDMAVERAA